MKTLLKTTMLTLLLIAFSCSKDDAAPVVNESSANAITSFIFNAADNSALSNNITTTITDANKTILGTVSDLIDVTSLTPTIVISSKASVSPTGAQDFSSPVVYTVTAEDGSKVTYTVSIAIEIATVTITDMSPTTGPKLTMVTFSGTNFGDDVNNVQVFFDDIETSVQSVTTTEIITTVPPLAFFGAVKIIVNGMEFTNFNFDYVISEFEGSVLAGSGTRGFADGIATNAQFASPNGVVLDALGNLYVGDPGNSRIRKITPEGDVSTFVGTGVNGSTDGDATTATIGQPYGLTIDGDGNIYMVDISQHNVRKITPEGVVSTLAGGTKGFADGTGENAQFNRPFGITVDNAGNVYVADTENHKIRKITPDGVVTTVAGSTAGFADGTGAKALFDNPRGIDVDNEGNLYVADAFNNRIRKITPAGVVTTVAGNGTAGFTDGDAVDARFSRPYDVAIDKLGNIYITDHINNKIRKLSVDGQVTTAADMGFRTASSLTIDDNFTIYMPDDRANTVIKITQE